MIPFILGTQANSETERMAAVRVGDSGELGSCLMGIDF